MKAAVPAVPWARWHNRHLQFTFLQAEGEQKFFTLTVKSTFFVKQALMWWTKPNKLVQGFLLFVSQVITITSDASLKCWGAHCHDEVAQESWKKVIPHSSNCLELMAAQE